MMESKNARDPILITFPPSLDSELGRFLLKHYGIQHQERRHVIIFSFFVTLARGSTVIFPLLYGQSLRLVGPRAMSEYFDARCAPSLRLWPQQESEKQQVEKDWTQFNQTLAIASARFAYYHLLPHRRLMIRPLSSGTPGFEQKSVRFAYPVFSGVLRTLLWLTSKQAQKSLYEIKKIFEDVDDRLANGRRFLVGDGLTLSDIAFAVAAAPVVLPSAYGGPIPCLADMPAAIQRVVNEMRFRTAGAFALRIYDEHRHRSAVQ